MNDSPQELKDVPIFILAGGFGTRLMEYTDVVPKPMVSIGDKPIIWHIMKKYSAHGFRRFIICTGYKSDVIKDYFLNYHALNSDFEVDLSDGLLSYKGIHHTEDWKVTVAFTGLDTLTGGRIGRAISKYLGESENFGVTYGDGLSDVDLEDEFKFHTSHGKIGTLLGVNPPSRFGELGIDGVSVSGFNEKPELENSWINGGFFFFKRDFGNYLSESPSLILEKEPLQDLSNDGELCVYKHRGFWQCMDTQRDKQTLESLYVQGSAPWLDNKEKHV